MKGLDAALSSPENKRTQNEAQEVRHNLPVTSKANNHQSTSSTSYSSPSIEATASGNIYDTANTPSPSHLTIAPSTDSYFDDPVPASNMSAHLKDEHETFKAKLIDDVLGKYSGDKVPIEKVVMIIWQFRDDPQVVKFMTRFVAKFSTSKHVFDGIEFYLPQLAHMIIHLEAEWDDAILERFALVIAQQSLHFALQLNWILQGAIEDYQPELPDGTANPDNHPLYYSRCIKLLTNMERCVVYREERALEYQRLYEKGKITKQEMQLLEQADRRFNAEQVTGRAAEGTPETFGGVLLYKRTVRTACYKPKPWKSRYFAIEERMLNCYRCKGGEMVRSMPIEGAVVEAVSSSKYKNMFRIANRNFEFRIRAVSVDEMEKWLKLLGDEADNPAVFGHMDNSIHANNAATDRIVDDMTPAQKARYDFFRDERDFIRRLTDIAEELRFKEPPERKKVAPRLMRHLNIAPCVYVPLCNSTGIWRRVHGTLYKDTRVFNTKERCPVIMHFLVARGEVENDRKGIKDANLDVAEYMHLKFDQADEQEDDSAAIEAGGDEEQEIEAGDLGSEVDSSIWHESVRKLDDSMTSPPGNGNRHLNKFLRESVIKLPRKLATRLEKPNRRASHLDSATGLQSVPILEGDAADEDLPISGGISVGKSSILSRNKILVGDMKEGEIDKESMKRAKAIIGGGENWAEKSKRMLEEAIFKPDEGQLEVASVMSKSNDDLRQEVFIMQMIHYYKSVFAKANLPLWLKTYRILSTSSSTGLLEVLIDSTSIDGLKKSDGYPTEGGLRAYFEQVYGPPTGRSFKAAQRNFMLSLAGYSIISYLLGLKDRHNGNIMISTLGHLMHIDFGFVMGMAPGNDFSMERAPFKLTREYVEVLGGLEDPCYKEYERLVVEGFQAARKRSQISLGLVEIMMYKSKYPCFVGSRHGNGLTLKRFESRLMLDVPDDQIEKRVKGLISTSYDHWGTNAYDSFQNYSNGYAI